MKYARGYRDPHRGLKVLSQVARELPGLTVLRVPMHVPYFLARRFRARWLRMLFLFVGHAIIPSRIAEDFRGQILIREFLTIPTLIISPWLWANRRRLLFLCQHNLSFAAAKVTHRYALLLLWRLGFRFVLFEDREAWRVVGGRSASLSGIFMLQLPMPTELDGIERGDYGSQKIAFIGNLRVEKSPGWAMEVLLSEIRAGGQLGNCSLLVGTPDDAFRDLWRPVASTIDTSRYAEYVRALREADVIVLPYAQDSYRYRTSGVLAEALACGCAIVVPDLATLREQVLQPLPVGACYSDPAGLPDAVAACLRMRQGGGFKLAREAHLAYRTAAGLRRSLQELVLNAA